jgi:shikimate kinase
MAESGVRAERIVLVGFMGAGKSTVGAELAQILGWEFRDMDLVTEERTGQSVPQIITQRGEPAFRAEELTTALELQSLTRVVIATGGGAFTFPNTRAALQQGSVTVWLRCDLDTVVSRVALDGTRPLARNRETIARLLAERESSYRLADVSVDAARAAPRGVAQQVVAAVAGVGGTIAR